MTKNKDIKNGKQTYEKVLFIVGCICSISIIILASMQLLGIWEKAINVFEPLVVVLMLIQTIQNWKKNRPVAIVSLCAGIFIFIVAVLIFLTNKF